MTRQLRPLAAIFVSTATVVALAISCAITTPVAASTGSAAGATATAICKSAVRPRLAARMARGIDRALSRRVSAVGLAIADPAFRLTCDLDPDRHFQAASVIKVTIISALLFKVHGPGHLTRAQRGLAWKMITESDNAAATDLWDEVGFSSLQRFVAAAHMRKTILDDFAWGASELTARDELTLLTVLTTRTRLLSAASRGYVLWLMSRVTPSQRWGVPAGAPADITVSVKNGWLPDPFTGAWHVNSIGVFRSLGRYRSRHIGYQIAILTDSNRDEAYGIDTIQAAAEVINRDIARA